LQGPFLGCTNVEGVQIVKLSFCIGFVAVISMTILQQYPAIDKKSISYCAIDLIHKTACYLPMYVVWGHMYQSLHFYVNGMSEEKRTPLQRPFSFSRLLHTVGSLI
jgi:hypothetical protein